MAELHNFGGSRVPRRNGKVSNHALKPRQLQTKSLVESRSRYLECKHLRTSYKQGSTRNLTPQSPHSYLQEDMTDIFQQSPTGASAARLAYENAACIETLGWSYPEWSKLLLFDPSDALSSVLE